MPAAKKYTGEFKQEVIETMYRERLGLRETARRFEIYMSNVRAWERIYLEEGVQGLYANRQGRKSGKPKLDSSVEKDLIREVQRLRAENEYLKNLNALVSERVKREKRPK